ncbi:glycosyltransferase family 2 protein [Candidatus Pacearchaeota archaeon]|nr:glycosyltransferase family 2 protein [Candidatus Pacearchaeota archaeon]
MRLEKVCSLICAYNEERTIESIVRGANAYADVAVVDDGSRDKTAAIAEEAGAFVLRHETNMGKGAALRTGFRYFLQHDYNAIITLDADGQHLPDEIPMFAEKLSQGYEVAVGKRDFRIASVPFTRKMGNLLDSYILSKLTGRNIYDAQSGYRMFKRHVIERYYAKTEFCENGFVYEPELLVKIAMDNLKIGWVDITTAYSEELESKMKPFRHTLKSMKIYSKCLGGKINKLLMKRFDEL